MANSANITLRTDVNRPLLYEEVDANFEELKLIIDDFNGVNFNDILTDAPSDGNLYVRSDGAWEQLLPGNVSWGDITGTLSNQTDLDNRFNLVEADVDQLIIDLDTLETTVNTNHEGRITDLEADVNVLNNLSLYTIISVSSVLNENVKYLITSSDTFTLPDTTGLSVGDTITIESTYTNSPTIQVDGGNSEVIKIGKTIDDTQDYDSFIHNINSGVVLTFNGTNWELY